MQIEDALAAYMLDRAVVTLGTIVENALMERTEPDDKGATRAVYTLAQLLTSTFRLPRPGREPLVLSGMDGVLYDEI